MDDSTWFHPASEALSARVAPAAFRSLNVESWRLTPGGPGPLMVEPQPHCEIRGILWPHESEAGWILVRGHGIVRLPDMEVLM